MNLHMKRIYVLRRPDNSFVAGYCEQKVEPQSVAK